VTCACKDAVAEQLLPRETVVVTGTRCAGSIENHLLEVVRVRPAALFIAQLGTTVRIAVDRRGTACDRVLEAGSEFTVRIVLDANPRIAIEDLARIFHVPVGNQEFAFEGED